MVARLQVSSKKVLRSEKLLKVWQALISMVAGIWLTLKHTLPYGHLEKDGLFSSSFTEALLRYSLERAR